MDAFFRCDSVSSPKKRLGSDHLRAGCVPRNTVLNSLYADMRASPIPGIFRVTSGAAIIIRSSRCSGAMLDYEPGGLS